MAPEAHVDILVNSPSLEGVHFVGESLKASACITLYMYHHALRVLERAGLMGRRRAARWQRCRIDAAPLKEVAG